MNKYERAFDRVCNRFKLNPSNWLPHIKPDGLYEIGTSFPNAAAFEEGKGNPVYIPAFSIYNAFWVICYTRRRDRWNNAVPRSAYFEPQTIPGRWESLWSFLSDVDLGVYDTTKWVPVHSDGS